MTTGNLIRAPILKLASYRNLESISKYRTFNNIKNRDDLKKLQENFLKKLISYSLNNVDYYNHILKDHKITNEDELLLSNFKEIPLLTKEIIRQNWKKLISKNINKNNCYLNSSGGSTGEPLRFIQDKFYRDTGLASERYYYENIIGIDEPYKKVILWGSYRDLKSNLGYKEKLSNWINNIVFLNSFRMSEEHIQKYISILNSFKPDLIRGYASSLYELCKYADKKNIDIHSPRVIVSSAETLQDEMRLKIETTLGTKVYNFYGSRESNNIAGECNKGFMHIFSFRNLLEILDKNNEIVKQGEEGKVVITNFFNYSMPFIRYDIGDLAILGPKKCSCGNPLPTLKKVVGRSLERLYLKNGTVVTPEFFTNLFGVVTNKGHIQQFQIVQEDYDKIKISIIVKDGNINLNFTLKDLENKIKLVMGKNCNIAWDFVEEISTSPSGKIILIKSKINN